MKKDTIRFDSADGVYAIEQLEENEKYRITIFKKNKVVYTIEEYSKKSNGELVKFLESYINLDKNRDA